MNFTGRIREATEKERLKDSERKFIYELVETGRGALTQISRKLRISKDTAHYTLEKLQQKKIISHISPVVDLTKLGFRTYHAFFVTNDENKKRKREFLQFLSMHENTKSVMEYTSRWEVEWTVVAPNIQEFDKILTNITTKFADVILEKSKLALIKGYKSTTVAARNHKFKTIKAEYEPDELDKKILSLLHKDGRMSSYQIAEETGVSSNSVRYRIKKMQESQVIRYFTATVNLNALNYHLYTVGIILKSLSSDQEAKLKEFIRKQRFIIRAVKILGTWDVMLTILADNIKHFHATIKQIEDSFSDIITSYDTLIGYEEKIYKYIPDIVLTDNRVNKN